MASNTYIQHYADGTQKRVRRLVKQGRKPKPTDLVKIKVEGMVLPAVRDHAKAEARKYNMTLSSYIEMALSLLDISKFSS